MEPAKVPLRIAYTIQTKIKRIWEHTDKRYLSGFGPDTIFDETHTGWFVSFEGSFESLFFGTTPPAGWQVGDIVNISFTKVPNE